jgi:membrane protein
MGIGKIFIEAFKEWVRDRAEGLAATLAFFELLSVGPIVGFIIFIAHKILGEEQLHQNILPLLRSMITPQLTNVIILLLSSEHDIKAQELPEISILSGLLLLWAGKEYFEQIKKTVLTTWNNRRDAFGIKAKIGRTVKAFKIAFIAVAIVTIFVFIRALLPHPTIQAGMEPAADSWGLRIIHWITVIVAVSTLRVFYFTYIPPLKINWKYTIPGAVLNAVLFLIGREVMEAQFNEHPEADAAESVILVLLWFYYSNLIFVYSSEFTRIYVSQKQKIDFKNLDNNI